MRPLLVPILLACVLPLFPQSKGGVGDLMVMPTRLVLEGRDRSGEITLRNSGKAPCTYRISFQEMRMLPSGQVEVIPKAEGTVSVADLVRFTPKQVDLAPGETQTIRVQLRKPEGLPEGEYRSHMVFQGLPPVEPPKPTTEDTEKVLSFDIRTLVSLSIPIIVRHGETRVEVGFSDMIFHPAAQPDAAPSLDLTLNRRGNRSVQGEFKVDWLPASGKARTVLPILGTVVYAGLDACAVHMDLAEAKGLALKNGRLKVVYSYRDIKQPPVTAFLDLP